MKNELLDGMLRGGNGMLKMTVADMTDAELAQRPTPAANNGLWQLGHLASSEAWMVNLGAGKTVVELPAGFADRYNKQTAGENDPAKLGAKAELLAQIDRVREATANWAATLTAEQMAAPGPEQMKSMCPTVGHIVYLLPVHTAMHLGQLQVLRRKLGKPVLF